MMKKIIALFAMFLTFLLISGQPEKTVNLSLSVHEINYILYCLSKEPKKDVDSLYNKIYDQAIAQVLDSLKTQQKPKKQ